MGANLFVAFGLMLVFEGALPFLAPATWRETFKRIVLFSDGQLRFCGLSSIMLGLLLFWIAL